MATLRPAPGVGACGPLARDRADRSSPLGLGAARRAQPRRCSDAELNVGYWVDEGLSVGIADRPLTDIPGVLRQDGSPPLYYMLLHVWMSLAGSDEKATHTLSLLFALLAVPAAFWARGARVRPPRGVVRGGARRAQPVPHAVRAGDAHVLARRAARACSRTALYLRAYTGDERPARRWPVLFGLALAAVLYTHNWALFLGVGDVASPGSGCSAWRPRPSAGRGCATARSGSGWPRCCTCRGCRRCCSRPRTRARRGRASPATRTSRWRRRTGCSATRRGSCSWSRPAAARSRSCGRGAAGG